MLYGATGGSFPKPGFEGHDRIKVPSRITSNTIDTKQIAIRTTVSAVLCGLTFSKIPSSLVEASIFNDCDIEDSAMLRLRIAILRKWPEILSFAAFNSSKDSAHKFGYMHKLAGVFRRKRRILISVSLPPPGNRRCIMPWGAMQCMNNGPTCIYGSNAALLYFRYRWGRA